MDKDLKKIINTFGINNQQRKLQEEIFELQEAITCFELNNSVSYEIPLCELAYGIDSIKEELADCMVLLNQIMINYNITNREINEVMNKKIERTIDRIEQGYYETKNF